MSHTVVMEFSIDDKGALEIAAVALGLEYRHGQRTFRRYHGTDGCDDAISIPGNSKAYEIGVQAKADGSGFELLWDNYCGGYGLTDKVGEDGKRLYDEYNAAFLTKQYENDGFSISRTNAEDGRILLEAYR